MVNFVKLQKMRDTLLRENKFDEKKQPSERMAYANGVLDMYNDAIREDSKRRKEKAEAKASG